MARRGPLSAAKRKREMDKREKRQAKQERRAKRAAERAQARDAEQPEPSIGEADEQEHRV